MTILECLCKQEGMGSNQDQAKLNEKLHCIFETYFKLKLARCQVYVIVNLKEILKL